ncbi:hypothetical protein EXIGLDRAFT_842941 [Exidia glandulosa HHB12029]|uniref:F-box domain-containing protein n=1 Tax=Exidia glandulosa HHB12029 TaxID=1314781 RepID=A0A165CYV9_EXIGL|nr:hypothetical protein EXIGLDRAFT_842941 [Exidia glandulosa HHB12029]
MPSLSATTMWPGQLNVDVLCCVVEFVDLPGLLALACTSRLLRRIATPALYARVELGSYSAFYSFARTLDASPTLGAFVQSFTEATPGFFYDERGPPPDGAQTLGGALRLMPNLRDVTIVSHLEVDAEAFAQDLRPLHLRSLAILNVSHEMAAVLQSLSPIPHLILRGQRSVSTMVASYLVRCRESLLSLETDGDALRIALDADPRAVWPRLKLVRLRGDWPNAGLASLSQTFPSLNFERSTTKSSRRAQDPHKRARQWSIPAMLDNFLSTVSLSRMHMIR